MAREHDDFGADSASNTEQLAPMADGNVIQMNRSIIEGDGLPPSRRRHTAMAPREASRR
jgi:hypothetical protein